MRQSLLLFLAIVTFTACGEDPTGTGDGAPPSLVIDDVSVTEGAGVVAAFTVSLSAASGQPVTVDYATSDGTAVAGSDYSVVTTTTLTFLPGETSRPVSVSIVDDALYEDEEEFAVNLTNASNATISDGEGTCTVIDDEAPPSLSIDDVVVTEGAGVTATFTVSLSAQSSLTTTVDYTTSDGTAIAGSDYTASSGGLTFQPGETTQTVDVMVLDDALDEADETFEVILGNASAATIADGHGEGTIQDDADVAPSLSIDDVVVTEGAGVDATFTVSLSAPSGQVVTVDYATSDGTALAGSDYAAGSGSLTFQPGETAQTVGVVILDDGVSEGSEAFTLNLDNPENAVITDGTGAGTITDDEGTPNLSIDDTVVTEGAGATAMFTVSLSPTSVSTVTVDYSTSDGTAVAGSDYTAVTTTTLTFLPGESSQSIEIGILDDDVPEVSEVFAVQLENPSNAVISVGQGEATIYDDDGTAPISLSSATPTGSGLIQSQYGVLEMSNHGGVTVRITSSNPQVAVVSVDASTEGTEFVDIPMADGATAFVYYTHGLEGQTGTVTITASAPGFIDGSNTVEIVTPAYDVYGLTASATTLSVDDPFQVRVGIPNAQQTALQQAQALRAGAPALTFTVTNSNDLVGQLVTTAVTGQAVTVDIAAGASASPGNVASGGVAFDPFGIGSTSVAATLQAGSFIQLPTAAQTITVSAPAITVVAATVGGGLQVNSYSYLGASNHGGVDVVITSSNPSVMLVSPDISTPGTESITVPLADGAIYAYYYVQGVEGATGEVTITVTAPGFTDGTSTITVVQSAVQLGGLATNTTASAADDPFWVGVGIPNAQQTSISQWQEVRAGAPNPYSATVTSSDAGVGQLVTAQTAGGTVTVEIVEGVYRSPADVASGGVAFDPLTAGTTTVAASIPGFVVLPTASQVVVIAPLPYELTVLGAGTGDGAVTSDPAGISCTVAAGSESGDCSELYDENTPVTLTAAADQGSTFEGWSGAGCTGTGTCDVTMDQGQTVTARFELVPCWVNDPGDADGDRLADCVETNTGFFVSELDTGTDPNDPDTDDDAIGDGDEVLGTLLGLDLPAMGVSPLRRDILVEYDWFDDALECGAHSHRPTAAAVAMVTAAFANAPVLNPDGSTGINFVHDYGQGGAFTGGNLITDADGVIAGGVNGTEFLNHKSANFAPNRNGYFHYTLLPHRYNTNSASSGQAEYPGDDLIVSLYCYGSDVNVGHTIMHELGHNLFLHHGGFEGTNYKPNYNSVMNYKYQFPGIDNNCTPPGDGVLDYSTGLRPPLDESNLDETQGICGNPPGPGWDWNGDGDAIDIGIMVDINVDNSGTGDGFLGFLQDYDDWAWLLFTGLSDADGVSLLDVKQIISCPNPAPAERR